MPIGDIIFQRLEQATPQEIGLISGILEVDGNRHSHQVINDISKSLRSIAGNSVANIFRDPHELPYDDILRDVCIALGEKMSSAIGIHIPPETPTHSLEDFIAEVAVHVYGQILPNDELRSGTLCEIHGRIFRVSALKPSNVRIPNVLQQAAGGAIGSAVLSLGASVLVPLAVGGAAVAAVAYAVSPSVDKITPAIVALIQIRKRLEMESMLANDDGGEDE